MYKGDKIDGWLICNDVVLVEGSGGLRNRVEGVGIYWLVEFGFGFRMEGGGFFYLSFYVGRLVIIFIELRKIGGCLFFRKVWFWQWVVDRVVNEYFIRWLFSVGWSI